MIKIGSLSRWKLLRTHSITMSESSSISNKLTPIIKIYPTTVLKIYTIKLKNKLSKIIKTENGSLKNDPIIFSANDKNETKIGHLNQIDDTNAT